MKKPSVAFQGELGAFSQIAVHQLLGDDVKLVPCPTFDDVFRRLSDKLVDTAVIPIENTLHGSIHENYDHLLEFGLEIVAETHVRIAHSLIAPPGVAISKIRKVYSHPVALNQCLKFFSDNPQFERITFYDTAGSVKMIMEERPEGGAAIASTSAAETYGGRILRRNIEDDPRNFTRFFQLRHPGKKRPRPEGKACKTSLVFATGNVPGALFRSLSALSLRDINLLKIESRPLRGKPWEYLFYLDFDGSIDEPRVEKALGHLSELADFIRVLGCYPKGT